nr:hypothetical protein [Burkholderia anthina]
MRETVSVVRLDLRRSVAKDPVLGRRIAKEANGERTVFGGETVRRWRTKAMVSMARTISASRGRFYRWRRCGRTGRGGTAPEWMRTDRYVQEDDPLQKMRIRGTPKLPTDDGGDVVWEASYKAPQVFPKMS